MAYKWVLAVVLMVAVFGASVGSGYYFQNSRMAGVEKPSSNGAPFQTELVDEAAVEKAVDVVAQETAALPELNVRLIGGVEDKSLYPYAMSLNAPPGDENPVWTAACRVNQGATSKAELIFYLNDTDYTQSTAADKKEQLETFLLGCMVVQDKAFLNMPREQRRAELMRMYDILKAQGVDLVL